MLHLLEEIINYLCSYLIKLLFIPGIIKVRKKYDYLIYLQEYCCRIEKIYKLEKYIKKERKKTNDEDTFEMYHNRVKICII